MTKKTHHMKEKKRIRNNNILECLRLKPLTSKQLSIAMGQPNINMHDACISMIPKFIKITGFIVGMSGRKSYLFQSIGLEYVEPEPEAKEVIKESYSVNNAIVYGFNNPKLEAKYREQSRQVRREQKSARNCVSGSSLSMAI